MMPSCCSACNLSQYVHDLKHGYYGRRHLARVHPDSRLSMIVDGSDNGEYGLPYFHIKTKETSKGFKLKTKLIGVLTHGRKVNIYTLLQNQGTGGFSHQIEPTCHALEFSVPFPFSSSLHDLAHPRCSTNWAVSRDRPCASLVFAGECEDLSIP